MRNYTTEIFLTTNLIFVFRLKTFLFTVRQFDWTLLLDTICLYLICGKDATLLPKHARLSGN